MTPERWSLIQDRLEAVLQLPAEKRCAYLDKIGASDAELRRELESLLAQDSGSAQFLEPAPAVAMERLAALGSAAQNPILGQMLGPYRVTQLIGAGGMGEVYRAFRADDQFKKEVAIKLVRAGPNSSIVYHRFRNERQILASLDHPNIARLFDGGTTPAGVPYLVMELIEGQSIDQYCNRNQLDIPSRLRLFTKVCAAVQYAHTRLIVHRDLKPGNILVTEQGEPKLLDFGIAKIVAPMEEAETTLGLAMTPDYASPEQVRGQIVTTATDVYSLGVVLYKLLTGKSPYRGKANTPLEWSRAIADAEPIRLSAAVSAAGAASARDPQPTPNFATPDESLSRLQRQLRGDLDDIVSMALRKEPAKRYVSVQQLSEDISRHLDGLPVIASKGTWQYRAAKFVQRHQAGVLSASLAVIALLVGVGLILRAMNIARAERRRADQRFEDVRQLSNSLIFDVNDAMADVPGNTGARKILLDRAVAYLDKLSQDANGNTALQRELAFGYERLASVQGNSIDLNVGEIKAANTSTQKAITLFDAVAKAQPESISDQLNLARVYRVLAHSDYYYPAARPEIAKALAVTDSLVRQHGDDLKVMEERALELREKAGMEDLAGDRAAAVASFRECVALFQKIHLRNPDDARIQQRSAQTKTILGFEFASTGDLDEAQNQVDAGVSEFQRLANQSGNPGLIRPLAASRSRQIFVSLMRGQFTAAEKALNLNYEALTRLASLEPVNPSLQQDIAGNVITRGQMLAMMGRVAEGRDKQQEGIKRYESIESEADTLDVAAIYGWLGKTQFALKKYPEALQSYQKAITINEKLTDYDDVRAGWATLQAGLGDTLTKLGRFQEADAAYRKALQKIDRSAAQSHRDMPALYPIADAYSGLGDLATALAARTSVPAEQMRLRKDACDNYRRSLEIWKLVPSLSGFSPSSYPAGTRRDVELRVVNCAAALHP
jgi:eukaryotic-like serine/threonine-protein kinase